MIKLFILNFFYKYFNKKLNLILYLLLKIIKKKYILRYQVSIFSLATWHENAFFSNFANKYISRQVVNKFMFFIFNLIYIQYFIVYLLVISK